MSSRLGREEYRYQVAIDEAFKSSWLPTQAPISAIRAEGDWRFDESTTDFFHWDEDLDTRGMEYSMTAVDLDITARGLEDASLARTEVDDEYLDLPDDLPDLVTELAYDVTGDALSKYEKSVALQDWFRANFEYSLDRGPTGSGAGDLQAFLSDTEGGRVGYCEQFAASMATMARVLGIPARMAIGFLEPDPVGDDTWVYSALDLHAWPELYFDGFGWVAFEPTPPVRARTVPSWARGVDEGAGPDGPDGRPSESASASAGPSAGPSQRPDTEVPTVDPGSDADQDGGLPWRGLGGRDRGRAAGRARAAAPLDVASTDPRSPAGGRPGGGVGRAAGHRRGPAAPLARCPVAPRHPRPAGHAVRRSAATSSPPSDRPGARRSTPPPWSRSTGSWATSSCCATPAATRARPRA